LQGIRGWSQKTRYEWEKALTFYFLAPGKILLTPLGHRGSEELHLGLQLAVLIGKLRGRTCSHLHLVRCSIPLLLSYDALLASLVVLAKSLLTLTTDGSKLGLELPRGS
jgi:hypothetical protein